MNDHDLVVGAGIHDDDGVGLLAAEHLLQPGPVRRSLSSVGRRSHHLGMRSILRPLRFPWPLTQDWIFVGAPTDATRGWLSRVRGVAYDEAIQIAT